MRGILLWCFLAAVCLGEEIPVLWNPPAGFPPTLIDIASRLPPNTPAKEPDLITYAHEGNHFLCKGRLGHHGVYVGNGERWYIPTPPIPTERVFALVPVRERGSLWRIYRQQGNTEYWRNQPLMILDEWRAYTVGSQTRKELGLQVRRETTINCAIFAGYARILYDLAREQEYDTTVLRDFCRWNLDQCRAAIPDWDQLTSVTFE